MTTDNSKSLASLILEAAERITAAREQALAEVSDAIGRPVSANADGHLELTQVEADLLASRFPSMASEPGYNGVQYARLSDQLSAIAIVIVDDAHKSPMSG